MYSVFQKLGDLFKKKCAGQAFTRLLSKTYEPSFSSGFYVDFKFYPDNIKANSGYDLSTYM